MIPKSIDTPNTGKINVDLETIFKIQNDLIKMESCLLEIIKDQMVYVQRLDEMEGLFMTPSRSYSVKIRTEAIRNSPSGEEFIRTSLAMMVLRMIRKGNDE